MKNIVSRITLLGLLVVFFNCSNNPSEQSREQTEPTTESPEKPDEELIAEPADSLSEHPDSITLGNLPEEPSDEKILENVNKKEIEKTTTETSKSTTTPTNDNNKEPVGKEVSEDPEMEVIDQVTNEKSELPPTTPDENSTNEQIKTTGEPPEKPVEHTEPKDEKESITIKPEPQADANTIINKVDENMSSKTRIVTSDMVIHGKRKSRTVSSIGYAEGDNKSFTEYLAPAREKGTKMLKLDNRLWIYSPSTDRTIQLSGHMLRQSVMGSDLSYEDMMEDRKLTDIYSARVTGSETIDGRKSWKLELIAKVSDVAYYKRKLWVDQERYVPLKEELYAKGGQLLKKTTLSDIKKVDGRWFPNKMNYKDMLKSGNGTDFIIKEIKFDDKIPAHIFTKGSLKK